MSEPSQPPGRQAVVVRAGPKKGKGRVRDGIIGILGALLLVGSVLLVGILPEDEPILPQYKASFNPEGLTEHFTQATSAPLAPGETVTFAYDIEEANIYSVVFTFTLADDMPGSDPDRFSIELESPNGTMFAFEAGDGLETAPREHTGSTTPPYYQTKPDAAGNGIPQSRATFNMRGVPEDYFFTTEDLMGSPASFENYEIKDALVEAHKDESSIGTWLLHVTMTEAGDCPATDDPTDANFQRGTECQADNAFAAAGTSQTDYATDAGNHVTVALASFSYYVINNPEVAS